MEFKTTTKQMSQYLLMVGLSLLGAQSASGLDLARIQINSPKVNYTNNQGSGEITLLSTVISGASAVSSATRVNQNLNVESLTTFNFSKDNQNLNLNFGPIAVQYNQAPQFLLDLNSLQTDQLAVDVGNTTQHSINLSSLELDHLSSGQISIKNLTVLCGRDASTLSVSNLSLNSILNDCFFQANIGIGALVTPEAKSFWSNTLSSFNSEMLVLNSQNQIEAQQTIKDFEAKVVKNDLKFEVKISQPVSGKIKGDGSIKLNEALNRIEIKIDKVKFGILNITDTFWKEIKNLDSEKVKVEPPFIYLNL